MKLGLLTAPFPETSLDDVADWTAANGFTTIEIACWPASSGDTRRYAGTSHIEVDGISDAQASEIVDSMTGRGLEISGLGYYPNPLHPDDDHARMVIEHLKKVIIAAGKMGVGVVNVECNGTAVVLDGLVALPGGPERSRQPGAGLVLLEALREGALVALLDHAELLSTLVVGLSEFVERHPTVKMLALAFLLMIGMMLIAEGLGAHVPKGYLYAAMAFSALVEGLNMLARRARAKRAVSFAES